MKIKRSTATKLRVIRDQILTAPRKFDMGDWATRADCGTACCIGGYACVNAGMRASVLLKNEFFGLRTDLVPASLLRVLPKHLRGQSTIDVIQLAQRLLGITSEQAGALFVERHWPVEFRFAFEGADSASLKSGVAAARIEHFIETGQ